MCHALFQVLTSLAITHIVTLYLPVQHPSGLFFSYLNPDPPAPVSLECHGVAACPAPGRPLSSAPSPHPPSPAPTTGLFSIAAPCPPVRLSLIFPLPQPHSRLSQKFPLKRCKKTPGRMGGDHAHWCWVACPHSRDWQLRESRGPQLMEPRSGDGGMEEAGGTRGRRQVKHHQGTTAHRTEEGPGVFPAGPWPQ